MRGRFVIDRGLVEVIQKSASRLSTPDVHKNGISQLSAFSLPPYTKISMNSVSWTSLSYKSLMVGLQLSQLMLHSTPTGSRRLQQNTYVRRDTFTTLLNIQPNPGHSCYNSHNIQSTIPAALQDITSFDLHIRGMTSATMIYPRNGSSRSRCRTNSGAFTFKLLQITQINYEHRISDSSTSFRAQELNTYISLICQHVMSHCTWQHSSSFLPLFQNRKTSHLLTNYPSLTSIPEFGAGGGTAPNGVRCEGNSTTIYYGTNDLNNDGSKSCFQFDGSAISLKW